MPEASLAYLSPLATPGRSRTFSEDSAMTPSAKRHRAGSFSTSQGITPLPSHSTMDWYQPEVGMEIPPPAERYPEHLASSYLPSPPASDPSSSVPRPFPSPAPTLSQPTRSNSLTAKALRLTTSAGSFVGHDRVPVRAAGAGQSTLSLAIPSGSWEMREEGFDFGIVGELVDISVVAIDSIWGVAEEGHDGHVLPLRQFVNEVLRRSRTSRSTLQVALYYLHRLRRELRTAVINARSLGVCPSRQLSADEAVAYPSPTHSPIEALPTTEALGEQNPLLCGRRMFLASIMCASKFIQDRNYSNSAWAKFTALSVTELTRNERRFLELIDYDLFISADDFEKWTLRLSSLRAPNATFSPTSSAPSLPPPSNRFPLERRATEYPSAPALVDLRSANPNAPSAAAALLTHSAQRVTLGRSSSHPSISRRDNPLLVPALGTTPARESSLQKGYAPRTRTQQLMTPPDHMTAEPEHWGTLDSMPSTVVEFLGSRPASRPEV